MHSKTDAEYYTTTVGVSRLCTSLIHKKANFYSRNNSDDYEKHRPHSIFQQCLRHPRHFSGAAVDNSNKKMRESQYGPTSWDQQQTGESPNSSADDTIDDSHDRMEEERILRTISNFLNLLTHDSGTLMEKNRTSDETFDVTEIGPAELRTRRRSRRRTRSGGNRRQITTPEMEIPLSLEQTSEHNSLLSSIMMGTITITPDCPAPGLVQISPNPDFERSNDNTYPPQDKDNETTEDFVLPEKEKHRRSRSWTKQKLAAAIFSHPQPLRNFCLEAYEVAKERSLNNNYTTIQKESPRTEDADGVLLLNQYLDERITHVAKIPRGFLHDNIPLSVTLDTLNAVQEITLDVSFATVSITVIALDASVHTAMNIWGGVTRFNPLNFANDVVVSGIQSVATGVVVSGIQSVATGVGSASSMALNRLSAKNRSPLSTGLVRSPAKAKKMLNQKLLRKLNNLNSAAPVVSYEELGDSDGGLSRHAKSRVQRMMHYDVSLRPFVATVKLQETFKKDSSKHYSVYDDDDAGAHSETSSPLEGPFMCTPQSFPPTPASRAHVLKTGSRFADDVVFLARDQLRVHDGLESSNERTREMAQALTHGKRLAVFDADDASAGIDLSCGQHGKWHHW